VGQYPKHTDRTSEFNFYPDRNPNPVASFGVDGEIYYQNKAAELLIGAVNDDSGSPLPEGFLKTIKKTAEQGIRRKRTWLIKGKHFSFSFCPRSEEKIIDVYAVDISEEKRQETYFSVLSAFSNSLIQAQTEEEVAWTIAKEAISQLDFVDCVVYLVDRKSGCLRQRSAYGPKSPKQLSEVVLNPISLDFGQGVVGSAAALKQTVKIDDVSKDQRYVVDDEERSSELAVPIIALGEVIGVIDSEHPQKGYFTQQHAKILEAIASVASTRIQRARALEEIKFTEAKYRSFVENAFAGLYIVRNEKFEYVNQQFSEMIGYSSEELLNSDFNLSLLIRNADKAAKEAMQARIEGDLTPKSYRLEVNTKRNTIKQLAINTCILYDDQGMYSLGIALDVTDTIESQKELEKVIFSLEKKTEELNEFAHLASHNLRAPVANLKGLLEHYQYNSSANDTNDFIIDKFFTSVNQLDNTLEEMHQVLKVRTNQTLNPKEICFHEILNQVQNHLSETISENSFKISSSFNPPCVMYEKSHLENIFLNLITNAIKYRRTNVASHLNISSSLKNGQLALIFEDNGTGIDLEKYGDKVFGMYKRFHSKSEGRGVGLFLVKRQLESLGGKIHISSQLNEGTTFTVYLNPQNKKNQNNESN